MGSGGRGWGEAEADKEREKKKKTTPDRTEPQQNQSRSRFHRFCGAHFTHFAGFGDTDRSGLQRLLFFFFFLNKQGSFPDYANVL